MPATKNRDFVQTSVWLNRDLHRAARAHAAAQNTTLRSLIEAGLRFPTEQCEAAPAGLIASLQSMPTAAWLQIMAVTCMMETGYFLFEYEGYPNAGNKAPGDIGGDAWVRYDDPETKTFKLNVERQNGRAAMLGVFGCILHELVGVDALYPTGGLGNGAPPTIF